MDFATGAWCFIVTFTGLLSGILIVDSTEKDSPLEKLGALLTLIGAGFSVLMIFQGFHLWNMGWSGIEIPPETAGRVSAKARGKGGIILLAIQFLPQFLVIVFGMALWNNREIIRYSAKCLGIK
jgi:hypothetical protein